MTGQPPKQIAAAKIAWMLDVLARKMYGKATTVIALEDGAQVDQFTHADVLQAATQLRRDTGTDCQICHEQGILPSKAIACALHSIHTVRELEATVAALQDSAGVGGRLHLALADLDGTIPSLDGLAELQSVKDDRARMDRLRVALEKALAIVNYEDNSPLAPEGIRATAPEEP